MSGSGLPVPASGRQAARPDLRDAAIRERHAATRIFVVSSLRGDTLKTKSGGTEARRYEDICSVIPLASRSLLRKPLVTH
jgi:hypothetical protein